jgi:hypothetical protein
MWMSAFLLFSKMDPIRLIIHSILYASSVFYSAFVERFYMNMLFSLVDEMTTFSILSSYDCCMTFACIYMGEMHPSVRSGGRKMLK